MTLPRSTLVWRDPESVPSGLPRSSVTIGVFDGVHLGHQILLDHLAAGCGPEHPAVAVTFDPHPLRVVRPELAPVLLCTVERRIELLSAAGMDAVLVLPFTRSRSEQSAADFADEILTRRLRAERVVVGANFRFGHRASGDVSLLADLGQSLGFRVEVTNLSDGADGSAISSTRIREAISAGAVDRAARLLGRPHRVSGTVVRGDARGRELGFPTANLKVTQDLLVPAEGIYAGRMRAAGEPDVSRPAAVSIGTNPTFDGVSLRVEAYALDAPSGYDIYDQVVDIDFVDRIRGMVKFGSVGELVARMHEDVRMARSVLR